MPNDRLVKVPKVLSLFLRKNEERREKTLNPLSANPTK